MFFSDAMYSGVHANCANCPIHHFLWAYIQSKTMTTSFFIPKSWPITGRRHKTYEKASGDIQQNGGTTYY